MLNKDFWQSFTVCLAAWCVCVAAIWFAAVVFNP